MGVKMRPGTRAAKLLPIAVLLVVSSPAFAQSTDATARSLMVEIAALRAEQAKIAEAQQRTQLKLTELEQRLAESTASLMDVAKQASASPALKISGDLRVRSQGDYANDARDRESGQVRGRLAATYAVNDRVTLGGRLVTGDPDDPNSTDVQLSNFSDDLQVSLDLAYAQLSLGELKVSSGKIPQPFVRTDLVWDSDVNPQGASAVYKHSLTAGTAVRAAGVFSIVDEQAGGTDSTLRGLQIGLDAALNDWAYEVSAAYYDYRLGSMVGADAGDWRSNLLDPDGSYRSDFDLADIVLGMTWSGFGKRWPLRIVGDYVHNFGAATSADSGFGVDFTVGRATAVNDWRLTYGFSRAETDAVLAAFSHDNIALGTNYELHALTFDYVPWQSTMLSAIWYHYRPYQRIDALSWTERIRIALTVSF
jgi:hypothetical protein